MAHSPVAINPRWPGGIVAGLVFALMLGTLCAVAVRAEFQTGLAVADWAAIRFTVAQAFVSAALSCLLAIPVARALARRQFRGRSAIITLLGAPFLLPVIVAVLGLIMAFGRNGVLNNALGYFGLQEVSDLLHQTMVVKTHFFMCQHYKLLMYNLFQMDKQYLMN